MELSGTAHGVRNSAAKNMEPHSWQHAILNAVLFACMFVAVPASAANVFIIYMKPDGVDGRNGIKPETAVKTLQGVQDVLGATNPGTDVEVRIMQGVYVAPQTTWRYYIPGHSISFIPIDYDSGEGIEDIAGRPIFRGSGTTGYWFSARLAANDSGGDTNLNFRYLQVEEYSAGGIQFYGGVKDNQDGFTVPATAGINNNVIVGMKFYKLGSVYNPAGNGGRGTINTWNSSNNIIMNNEFVQNENADASNKALLHSIYLAHHSNRNIIAFNRFDTISGDPIRVRNDSNDNDIFNNSFFDSGNAAYYSDWFCDQVCMDRDPTHGRECASHGNEFFDNVLQSGYDGSAKPVWHLTPAGLDYAGAPACDNSNQLRVLVHGNTKYADFNGDGESDIFWRNSSTGENVIWLSGDSLTQKAVTTTSSLAWEVVGIGDFNSDGQSDILWRDQTTGANVIWRSGDSSAQQPVTATSTSQWRVAGVGDFDGDGQSDILWRNPSTGSNVIWRSGDSSTQQSVTATSTSAWKVAGIGDFNGDHKSDILWRNPATGANVIWRSGNSSTQQAVTATSASAWQVVGVGDFNRDGLADILWRNSSSGANVIWRSGDSSMQQPVTTVSDLAWKVGGVGDFDADGQSDILWRNDSTGANVIWRSGDYSTQLPVTKIDDMAWKVAGG